MAEIDVAQALVAIESEDVCRDVAAGSFDRLGDTGLTDEERTLVQEAAVELAESDVDGFGIIAPHIGSSGRLMRAAQYAGGGNLGSYGPQFNLYYQRQFGINFQGF